MTTDRSSDAALEVVKAVFEDREDEDRVDGDIGDVLGQDVVEKVFAQAWRFQFDEGQGNFKREAREIVSNAIEKAQIGGDNHASD